MITCWIDGLCEPNPSGVATYGVIINEGKKLIYMGSGMIGEGRGMSSNVAEYCALLDALDILEGHELKSAEIIIYTDSQVLAKQMNGEWKAVAGHYLEYYLKAKQRRDTFPHIMFQWVSRNFNKEADALTMAAYERYCEERGIRVQYRKRSKK